METNRNLNKGLIKSKIVYFLGTGFSKILDYPIMSEFVDKYLKDLPTRSGIIKNAFKVATGSSALEVILSVLEKMIDIKYSFNSTLI